MNIRRAAIDIALRDILRTTRSFFAVMFAFVVPLFIVGLMYLMMGGATSGEARMLPRISLYLVNSDAPQADGAGGVFSAGQLLVDVLQSEDLSELFATTLVDDESAARAAVDTGAAAVAVIVPEDLTAAFYESDARAGVVMIQDPTLTLAPTLVNAILTQFLDSFSGSRIAVDVVVSGLHDAGLPADAMVIRNVMAHYATWASEAGAALRAGETDWLTIQPATEDSAESDPFLPVIAGVTSAMLVVYAFYTGSAAAQSVMREEEEGTLQRLFMAPVSTATILAGKVLGSVLTLTIQVLVLLSASSLIFGVYWGARLPVALAVLGLIALASSFGIFVMSWVTTAKQIGIVYGAVMTLTGLFGTYAFFLPLPDAFRRYALFVPQGWAMRSWDMVVHGATVGPALLTSVGISLSLALVFWVVGTLRFRHRFAQ